MNIYVGNLSYNVTEDALRAMFEKFGGVNSAKLSTDRDTGHSKGFGFVEMETNADGHKAIENLNGSDSDGRALKVNVAKPREQGRGGNRGRFGGGGRNRY